MSGFQPYHYAWLGAHPHRTEEWLRAALRDGFDIHHIDGNHENNDPANLVLIEHTDHMMLHGGRFLGRLKPRGITKPRPSPRRALIKAIGEAKSALGSGATAVELIEMLEERGVKIQ